MNDVTKSSALIELLVMLVVPSLIQMKLSDPANLGSVNALLLALAIPLAWGARDLLARRKLNLFAALGLISILLTGGIGLLQLDTK
ncbi:MAG: VC0807 family protein [Thiobacillus sp.]|nr:VC0807 family protein [Thiobacillus sp.]